MSTNAPSATDLLSVKSRVSWGAIAAGAMIALAIYFLFTILGVALSIESTAHEAVENLGMGAAIYTIVTLLLAMFFGGWATSRLAVGETKLEAVLYGVILWGVLFTGLLWTLTTGIRVGFGAMVGTASGVYTDNSGSLDLDRIAADLKKAGLEQETVDRYRAYAEKVRNDPASLPDVTRREADRPEVRNAARDLGEGARRASWYTLAGVLLSMASVVFGSLVGAGEVPIPVPVLGVRRPARDPRS